MAFAIRNLSVLAYANGFTLWHYKAGSDNQGCIARPGYFNEAGDMLSSGDMLMVSGPDAGRMVCVVSGGAGIRTAPLG
jgi:hypothetical protein